VKAGRSPRPELQAVGPHQEPAPVGRPGDHLGRVRKLLSAPRHHQLVRGLPCKCFMFHISPPIGLGIPCKCFMFHISPPIGLGSTLQVVHVSYITTNWWTTMQLFNYSECSKYKNFIFTHHIAVSPPRGSMLSCSQRGLTFLVYPCVEGTRREGRWRVGVSHAESFWTDKRKTPAEVTSAIKHKTSARQAQDKRQTPADVTTRKQRLPAQAP
jgi:hypothetical protein